MFKVCKKCKEEKNTEDFYNDKTKKDGLMKSCKNCKRKYGIENKEVISNNKKEYYSSNKEELKINHNFYYQNNKEVISEKGKEYFKLNREKKINYQKSYYYSNIKKISNYKKDNRERINWIRRYRYHNDPLFRLSLSLRSNMSRHFKKNGYTKKSKNFVILGCSFNEFKLYIENLFTEGMSFENYGNWHLDHKIPISWAKTEKEIIKLNHYTNFKPMWAYENQSKGNRFSD